MTRTTLLALCLLAACTSSPTSSPDAETSRSDAMAHANTADAAEPSCGPTPDLFSCGPDTNTSCHGADQFCLVGDPTFGVSCRSVGGDGSTCPACADLLPIVQQHGDCGSLTPTCSGDASTGVVITCN